MINRRQGYNILNIRDILYLISGRGDAFLPFSLWGLSGTAVVLLGCIIPSFVYRGRSNKRFSPLNHYISELGERQVSRFATVFNISLVIAGIFFTFFMVEFGKYFGTFMAFVAAAAGVYSSLSCSLVGFFPMNNINMHMLTSMSFFYGGLVTIVLFGITASLDGEGKLPGAFIIFAAFVALVFSAFLLLPRIVGKKGYMLDPGGKERPSVWLMPIMEWLVLLGILGWITAISLFFI